jgi:hypothetical protein
MPGEVEPGGRGTFSDLEALPRLQEGSGTENTTGLGRNFMGRPKFTNPALSPGNLPYCSEKQHICVRVYVSAFDSVHSELLVL